MSIEVMQGSHHIWSAGRVNSITDERGRWYIHPVTEERFMSVTTALRSVSKDALPFWAAGLAAEAALDELPRLISATLTKPCGRTFNRCQHEWQVRCVECPCGQCPPCVGKWLRDRHIAENSRRAQEGTRVHDVIERWVLNSGEVIEHDDDIAAYVQQFIVFVRDYGLTPDSWEMAEATVINREYGYAGTLDHRLRFKAGDSLAAAELCGRVGFTPEVLLLGDTKTREKDTPAFYPDHALQLSAYRNAEAVLLPDGAEQPLSPVDGAFVLQLRRDGYELRLVDAGDRTFGAFLSVLSLAKWQWEYATASVSPRAFPKPKPEPQVSGGMAKAERAARKAAPKKAAEPKPTAATISETAARQSATLRSIYDQPSPHPDSPYGDEVPF